METWPDSAFTPFRCAKGSTWRAACAFRASLARHDRGRRQQSDGLFNFLTSCRRCSAWRARPRLAADRYIDGIDQSSFLLAGGLSSRKYHYYWLRAHDSALRCGECKFVMAATSDDDSDVRNPGGSAVTQRYPYGRLYNLYLDPKESELHDPQAAVQRGVPRRASGQHLAQLPGLHPPKKII